MISYPRVKTVMSELTYLGNHASEAMGKTPRLDRYLALIYRLYEALYLLNILGRVRGPHHVASLDFSTLLAVRRRFLKNAAFLCDHTKGGLTSTAVAVEDRKDCNVIWISSNEGPGKEVGEFLKSAIIKAKAFRSMPEDQKLQAEDDLVHQCVAFSSSRIDKQAHGLSNCARRCRGFIKANMVDQQDLGEWLRRFEFSTYKDLTGICQRAYESRNEPEMSLLLRLSGEVAQKEATVPLGIAPVFRKIRHIVGRLASHIRVVKEFIEDSHHLEDLLDVFDVAVVPRPTCVPRLPADSHTDLSGIVKRMLQARDERFSIMVEYLSSLDEQTGLEQTLQECFDSSRPPPFVHAEIQMLHHFYDYGRRYAAYDDYIATSKPACFCCKSYFRHHPANCVEPDSHEKIFVNWGPIRLAEGRKQRNDPTWIEHRKVMQNVINDLRREVLSEIERRRRFAEYNLHYEHPDSLTELTASNHIMGDDSSDSQDSQNEIWFVADGFKSPTDSDPDGEVEI